MLTSRRYAAGASLVLMVAALLARTLGARAETAFFPHNDPAGPDSASASAFLAGIRGASPLACELALRSIGNHWGSGEQSPEVPGELGLDATAHPLVEWATQRMTGADAVHVLHPALSDPDECVRAAAAQLLGNTRDDAAVSALLDALRSASPQTRAVAAQGLAWQSTPRSADPLMAALKD